MKRLLGLIPAGVPLAVFLDYDGTLVPIRKRPDLARLHPKRKALLARLGRRTLVGLVSASGMSAKSGNSSARWTSGSGSRVRAGPNRASRPSARTGSIRSSS